MSEKTLLMAALAAVGALGLAAYFLFDRFMWRKIDIAGLLGNEIRKRGGTLLSIEKVGWFDTGPFPKLEVAAATPDDPAVVSTAVPLGNKTFYEKVHWQDAEGRRRASWAKMEFVPFYRLRHVEWRDDV